MNEQWRDRRFFYMMFSALVFAVPACGISSDNPLSDPQKAKVDEELLGTWENPNPDPASFCKTLTVEKLSLPGYPPGALKLTMKPRDASQPAKIGVCFCTELNGRKYAYHCGPLVDDGKQLPTWEKLVVSGYGIYKYRVSGGSLTLWGGGGSTFAKAVEAGKVKGKWAGGPYYSYIQLTDTTANLAKFLSSDEADALLGEEGVLKRVK
jgi:hypothetical protein